MALKKFTASDRSFFKPAEHANAFAILAEPKEFKPQHPCYQGELKDVVFADLAVFETAEKGVEPTLFLNAQIEAVALVNQLKECLGDGTVVTLTKKKSKTGGTSYWSFEDGSAEAYKLAEAYIEKRDAALADVPEYLK
ncbi:hypothetical protein [Puerhibacterium puerhi]|uniref:hypothetical protein n=1 Tax=Puerhibacterium puerhi TaxID=2692623 RepID=UPI0013571573|nr:hypothetical protein [Puerhibacterium puerhi]